MCALVDGQLRTGGLQLGVDAADDVAATVRALSALTDPAHAEALDIDMHDLTEDDREEAGRLMACLITLADALEEAAGR